MVNQEGSTVEKKVKELQDRVGHLMIVVVDNVTQDEEEAANVKAKNIERDMAALLRCHFMFIDAHPFLILF